VYPRPSIGVLVPWRPQGLGYQAKAYVLAIEKYIRNVHVYIFSYGPYFSDTEDFDPSVLMIRSEWVHPGVYQHGGTREDIDVLAFIAWIRQHRIRVLLFPEPVAGPSVKLVRTAQTFGTTVISVPNWEFFTPTHKHAVLSLFDRTLVHTESAQLFCNDYAPILAPFPVQALVEPCNRTTSRSTYKLLLVGGISADIRKRARQWAEAVAAVQCPQLHLYITTQVPIDKVSSPYVTYIEGHVSASTIRKLRASVDIEVLTSTHEGLGLVLYEAVAAMNPVVVSKTYPHVHFVQHGVNGWVLEGTFHQVRDYCVARCAVSKKTIRAWLRELSTMSYSRFVEWKTTSVAKHNKQWLSRHSCIAFAKSIYPAIQKPLFIDEWLDAPQYPERIVYLHPATFQWLGTFLGVWCRCATVESEYGLHIDTMPVVESRDYNNKTPACVYQELSRAVRQWILRHETELFEYTPNRPDLPVTRRYV